MENVILYYHFFLIKFYVYSSREKGFSSVMSLVVQMMKIKKIEKEKLLHSEKKRTKYNKDWRKTDLEFVV